MVNIDIKDTELIWPLKFDEHGKLRELTHVNLPFQIIETINESTASRDQRKNSGTQRTLFDIWLGDQGQTFETGWKNKLIWGENKYVISSLAEKFAGKIDLIYIDPPFNTGDYFTFQVRVGDQTALKEPSPIELKAYNDTWGGGTSSYLQMIYDRLYLMKDLLSTKGSIYVHMDPNVGHYVKVVLDEIFGKENFLNEIMWKRSAAHNDANRYGSIHDNILLYSKSEEHTWNRVLVPLTADYKEMFLDQIDQKTGKRYARIDLTAAGTVKDGDSGKPWRGINPTLKGRHWALNPSVLDKLDEEGKIHWPKKGVPRLKRFEDELEGMPLQDVWNDIRPIHNQSSERIGFPTQKPEALLQRIINASSNPGDLVADFFCGSGTTLAAAEKLGRRWIGCDISRFAIHGARKRLLGIDGCKPFEILNLGKYERQVWQSVSFLPTNEQTVLYQYLAFILKLYKAEPISGFQSIHGRKGKALVHVGSLDSPVTINEVMAAINEVAETKATELHMLGWEWEMGLDDLVKEEANRQGIKLRLLVIPNEIIQADLPQKEDVKFYDLAYVKAKTYSNKGSVFVELTDFAIPNTELVPEDFRVNHWSDLIDYWAVDFDFRNDTFMNHWSSYRTKETPKLHLKSSEHEYKKGGLHNLVVKIVDIFGIDSSRLFEVSV